MTHPWLEIPLSDYEQHMALPNVGQAQMLSQELAAAVTEYRPRSIAMIGCAGGNGFDRLLSPAVERVVGIDVNPAYIEATRARYAEMIPGLELHVADVETGLAHVAAVDLVFAGLIFEYVDVLKSMRSLRGLCKETGIMLVVLQLPNVEIPAVSPSTYTSLQTLSALMQLRDPVFVATIGHSLGLKTLSTQTVTLPSGKAFAVMALQRFESPLVAPGDRSADASRPG